MNPAEGAATSAPRRRIFLVTAPGLEALAAEEMSLLGVEPVAEEGGVAAEVTAEQLYSLNLHLRTVSRVVVRVAEFRARTFYELERHAKRVDWGAYLGAGRRVRFRVTSRKSKLYHQRAIEQRLREAVGAPAAGAPALEEDEEMGSDEQLFIVRFLHDRCTISADSSGALLHQRGYRLALGLAPLRETLAAAMLHGSGWDPGFPLIDPLCGSGTIPIEAALRARRIPPGLAGADRAPRTYAFESWPDFEPSRWRRVVEEAREKILPAAPARIIGSDRDAGGIAAALANAGRAGVEDDLELEVRAASALPELNGPAWLVTNPPYGVRVGEAEPLRNLYAALGSAIRRALPGSTVALLSADPRLEGQLRLPLREVLTTRNGGIPVRLVVGRVG